MQFTRENRHDIEKYYCGTYVKFKEHAVEKQLNTDTLFYIEHCDGERVVGKCENGSQFVIWLSDTFPFEVDYVLPHKSFFQMEENAVLLERIPAQQYHRGLCSGNTQMTFLSAGGMPKKVTISFASLKQYVTKKKFFSLSDAILASECSSCVLSPRMQFNRSNSQILIDHLPVAKVVVTKHGKSIVMHKDIFREEVEELLKANEETDLFHFMNKGEREKSPELEVSL